MGWAILCRARLTRQAQTGDIQAGRVKTLGALPCCSRRSPATPPSGAGTASASCPATFQRRKARPGPAGELQPTADATAAHPAASGASAPAPTANAPVCPAAFNDCTRTSTSRLPATHVPSCFPMRSTHILGPAGGALPGARHSGGGHPGHRQLPPHLSLPLQASRGLGP